VSDSFAIFRTFVWWTVRIEPSAGEPGECFIEYRSTTERLTVKVKIGSLLRTRNEIVIVPAGSL